METAVLTLKEQWDQLRAQHPRMRIRNCAAELGVSEVELLATNIGGTVTRLRPDFKEIMSRIPNLGYVMALTRNDEVVHERKGEYKNPSFGPHASLFLGEDIDLRFFLTQWNSAFAVQEIANEVPRNSFQFFGKDGEAIHKIYLNEQSNLLEYEDIIGAFKSEDQSTVQEVVPVADPQIELPDKEIDGSALREEWLALKDTHDFYGMLKKYRVTRTQALRMAPAGDFAIRVGNDALRKVFETVSEKNIPIMVFVGNKGMIQIHTGPIEKLVDYGDWFNVLDPTFNLHVKEPDIAQTWIVRKPSDDGIVTSLELFNAQNVLIATIFGKRKPGIPELEEWRAVIADLQAHYQSA